MNSLKKIFLLSVSLFSLLSNCFAEALINVNIPEREKCKTEPAYFSLDWTWDSILLGASVAEYGTALVLRNVLSQPEYTGQTYDIDSVPAIDRWAMQAYNHTIDNIGTLTCGIDLALLPALLFAGQTAIGNLPLKDLFTITIMYAETIFFTQGTKDLLKISMLRVRPYMYFEGYDTSSISNHDFEYSWPSGHTTNAFMGAGFVSYVFCMYYPNSVWKIPVIATSYALAVGTGALRMLSGNHFFTDVLTGAALGTVFGLGVPFLHHLIANAKSDTTQTNASFNPLKNIYFTGTGLNILLKI